MLDRTMASCAEAELQALEVTASKTNMMQLRNEVNKLRSKYKTLFIHTPFTKGDKVVIDFKDPSLDDSWKNVCFPIPSNWPDTDGW